MAFANALLALSVAFSSNVSAACSCDRPEQRGGFVRCLGSFFRIFLSNSACDLAFTPAAALVVSLLCASALSTHSGSTVVETQCGGGI